MIRLIKLLILFGPYACYSIFYLNKIEFDVFVDGDNVSLGANSFKEGKVENIINSKNLTSIGNYAFYGCTSLGPTLDLSENQNTLTIGTYAFDGCTSLTTLILPNSLSIGAYSFENCSNLTYVKLPIEYTYVNVFLNDYVIQEVHLFNGGDRLPTETIQLARMFGTPWNVSTRTDLNVYFDDGVSAIGNYTFYGSNIKWENLHFPSTLLTIGEGAFMSCKSIEGEITLPESVTTINASAFRECISITGTVTMPTALTTIADYVFYGCTGINNVVFHDGLTSIGEYAFNGCTNLNGVIDLPDSITTIGTYAFYGCSLLSGVVIGDSIATIGASAFGGCLNIASLEVPITFNVAGIFAGSRNIEYFRFTRGLRRLSSSLCRSIRCSLEKYRFSINNSIF